MIPDILRAIVGQGIAIVVGYGVYVFTNQGLPAVIIAVLLARVLQVWGL